jgi:hypothetical protein
MTTTKDFIENLAEQAMACVILIFNYVNAWVAYVLHVNLLECNKSARGVARVCNVEQIAYKIQWDQKILQDSWVSVALASLLLFAPYLHMGQHRRTIEITWPR